jgi:tetratricopeptide (TPR) repeat protein
MVTPPYFGSPSFNLVAKGLLELHRMIKDGKDDSPEAEFVRDALDAPLNALNRIEKERAQWLSEDLYSVSEPATETTPRELIPQAQQQLYEEANEARKNREWDRALMLLRRLREFISPALLSCLRGSIWFDAGNPDIAVVFYRHASESDLSNANYRAAYMQALEETDPDAARKLARDILSDDEKHAPIVIARAAYICINESRTGSDAGATQLYRGLIPILDRNMATIDSDNATTGRTMAYATTSGLLGYCHEFLGNARAAVDAYSRGLLADPSNDMLFVARGILLYGNSPRAIADFEHAIGLGSSSIWPYLFLTHHYLLTNRFDNCRITCEMGLRMEGSGTAKSLLEDWRAIAQAELGFSPELVRAAFEAAIRWDPSNDFATRNQLAFEASLKTASTISRSKWEEKSVAAVRQFGMAERRSSSAA